MQQWVGAGGGIYVMLVSLTLGCPWNHYGSTRLRGGKNSWTCTETRKVGTRKDEPLRTIWKLDFPMWPGRETSTCCHGLCIFLLQDLEQWKEKIWQNQELLWIPVLPMPIRWSMTMLLIIDNVWVAAAPDLSLSESNKITVAPLPLSKPCANIGQPLPRATKERFLENVLVQLNWYNTKLPQCTTCQIGSYTHFF